VERISDDFDRDFFKDAESAVEYGLIDEVLQSDKETINDEPDKNEEEEKEV